MLSSNNKIHRYTFYSFENKIFKYFEREKKNKKTISKDENQPKLYPLKFLNLREKKPHR
jgi:hypothetical protein